MEYMSCAEAAAMGIQKTGAELVRERIPGVSKFGSMWLIPKDAEKPTDRRRKEFQHE